MSVNKGSYDDMSIRSSIDLKDHDKNNDIAVQVQYFLLHLLACNLISLTIVLCKLWNEIFGGLVFGFIESYSFLHICKISLLVCLPIGLLYLRGLQVSNRYDDDNNATNNDNCHHNSRLIAVYIFNIFQSLGLISFTSYIESDTILIGIASTIFINLQLLVLYSCCNIKRNRVSRIIFILITLILFISITCIYNWKFNKLKFTLLIFICSSWYYFRLTFTLEQLVHTQRDQAKYPRITSSLFIITFFLDVYLFLIIEYMAYRSILFCFNCCCTKTKNKRRIWKCCRYGTYYYPFMINSAYVDEDIGEDNEYFIRKDTSRKRDVEENAKYDKEGKKTALHVNGIHENKNKIDLVVVVEEKTDSVVNDDVLNEVSKDDSSDVTSSSSSEENDETDDNNNIIHESLESEENSEDADNVSNNSSTNNSNSDVKETLDTKAADNLHQGKIYVISNEVNSHLSENIQDAREVNRRLDAFLLLHDDHANSDYESLLYGLYNNCCSIGEKRDEFSPTTWKLFNFELRKYDKSFKVKANALFKKKKKKKRKKKAGVEISYPNVEHVDAIYQELSKKEHDFQLFKHLWKCLSESMFFTATVHEAEIKFTEEFGIPMTKDLSKKHNMHLTRERSLARVLKSEAVSTIFRNFRQTLKSLFIFYAPLSIYDKQSSQNNSRKSDKPKQSLKHQQRLLTWEKYYEFCDDFSLSKSSVPMHLKLFDLRNIFNLVLINNNNTDDGCTFGQYRAVLLRIAIEITYPLNVKNSGAIKAGEAARALSILLNELDKQTNNSGNKFVVKR